MRRLAFAALAAAVLSSGARAQTVSLSPVADATLYEDPQGGLADGSGAAIFVGRTNNAGSGTRRGLLRFDLASVIPPGFVVVSASLTLDVTSQNGNPSVVALHRATAPWNEGPTNAGFPGGDGAPAASGDATWTHANFPAAPWTNLGGDFAAAPVATLPVVGPATYVLTADAVLLADLQDQLDRPAANFGWLLKTTTETAGVAKRISSRENVGFEPILTVAYAPPIPASAVVYGVGCVAAPNAAPFALGVSEAPRLGAASFALTLAHGPPAGAAWIFLAGAPGAGAVSFGGSTVYLDEVSAATFLAAGVSPLGPWPLDAGGAAALPLPLPPDPALAGFLVYGQALSAGAGPTGFALSNGLALVVGV